MRFNLIFFFIVTSTAHAFTLSSGRLVEDFSTDDFADYTSTTGVWNIVDHVARAGAVANGLVTRPISFGDGSDGNISTSGGFAFNTDTHPSGYNFKSLDITGGAITVTGSNALVIRSLTTVNITPAISLNGSAGVLAVAGSALAGKCAGGSGGAGSTAVPTAGADGFIFDASQEAGTGGAAFLGAGNATDGNATSTFAGANFDNAASFICGGGGAGGGAHSTGAALANGGAGGGGGGVLKIAAVGNLSVGATTSNGGAGANGVNNGGNCSGNGAGGNGGAVWLQTLHTLTTGVDPTETAGIGGTSPCTGAGASGSAGQDRGDSAAGSRPVWASTGTDFNTDNAAASQSYVVQSKTYDLGTLNAGFSSQASITQIANGGSIAVKFAGSTDNKTFSGYTTDLTSLSGKNYRYLKFQVAIVTAGVAGASPTVSQIAIDFKDLGLERLDLKLSPGCASIKDVGNDIGSYPHVDKNGRTNTGANSDLYFWALFWIALYGLVRRERRAAKRKFPT